MDRKKSLTDRKNIRRIRIEIDFPSKSGVK